MPAKGSGVQENMFLAAVIEANTSPMNVDWNRVASLIDYGSAKSASTRFGIIRKRCGFTKQSKTAHVSVYARKVAKTRTSAKGAANHASSAKPADSIKKDGERSIGGKGMKPPKKVEDDEDDEDVKDLMASSNDVQQDPKYDNPEDDKRARELMFISDQEEEQEQESFQSQVNRGLYDEPNAEEDEGSLSDGEVELLNRQIAQQQEARLQAQINQQGVYEEFDPYEPDALNQSARIGGSYHEKMVQEVKTYYK